MNAEAEGCAEIDLEVVPNSKQFGIAGFNPWTNSLRVKIKAKPDKGKANDELILQLEKLFHAKPLIISGEKSRKKKLRFEGISEKELAKRISEICQKP